LVGLGCSEIKEDGFDDIKIAVPLRKYMNRAKYSGHIGIVPQIRFGGDDGGEYAISDGSTDFGLSITYENERTYWIFSFDFTYWWETDDNYEDEWSTDVGIGWRFHKRGSLRLETEYEKEKDDNFWLATGPTLFWNFNNLFMTRIEYKFSIEEKLQEVGLTKGDTFRLGLGVVF